MALKGTTVILHERVESGTDPFGHPIYEYQAVQVDNVLISPTTSDDLPVQSDLGGKKDVYTLAIPKGDTHNWEDAVIEFWGKKWKSFGFEIRGIEEMIPLQWHKKIQVERYGK